MSVGRCEPGYRACCAHLGRWSRLTSTSCSSFPCPPGATWAVLLSLLLCESPFPVCVSPLPPSVCAAPRRQNGHPTRAGPACRGGSLAPESPDVLCHHIRKGLSSSGSSSAATTFLRAGQGAGRAEPLSVPLPDTCLSERWGDLQPPAHELACFTWGSPPCPQGHSGSSSTCLLRHLSSWLCTGPVSPTQSCLRSKRTWKVSCHS